MNTRVKTNRLEYTLDRNALAERFELFSLTTCEKYVKRGAYILDASVLCSDIKAIKFESGRRILILMRKSSDNLNNLKQIIRTIEDGDKYSIEKMQFEKAEDAIVIQLLLNAMGSYESEFLKFNNLTGHLYCFHPSWIKHGKEKGADVIWGLQSLEVVITKDLCLALPVRSFTSELLRKKITFTRKKFEDYPKYVFSVNNTLCRRLKDSKESCFIMRQLDGTKKEIPFLDIQNLDKYEKTKMGMICNILSSFNDRYEGICHLDFQYADINARIDYSKAAQRENAKRITEVLSRQGVNIVDQIEDEYSEMFCENIKALLLEKYDIAASIGKRVKKESLNILLIHNAEYYDGENDPHDKKYEDVAVQHITFEDFSDSSEFALSTVIHEIIIKQDLVDKRISLFDWKQTGFVQDVSFGTEVDIDETKRYFFMTVHPDGTIVMKEQEYTLFEMNEYTELVDIYEQAKADGEVIKGIVRFGDGRVNVIKDTQMFTIPEIEKLQEYLKVDDNKLRGRERREELLSSSLDIKSFEIGNEQFYFVGTIGEGMKQSIQRSAVVRSIQGLNDSPEGMEKLLPLMNVSFVHNGQLTVIPFPFKYLREYIKSFMNS